MLSIPTVYSVLYASICLPHHIFHVPCTGGTPGPNTPQTHHRRQPNFSTQRERLYRAGPGRYVAMEDVDPQQSEDIPLRRGMDVEGVFLVYWNVDIYMCIQWNLSSPDTLGREGSVPISRMS